MVRIQRDKNATHAGTPPSRSVVDIATGHLAREAHEQLRNEIGDLLSLFQQQAAVDLIGVREIARDVWLLGRPYRPRARRVQAALDGNDLTTVEVEFRAVLEMLSR